MSITNNKVISKALTELKIIASGESATAEDADDMLDVLNNMMAEWEEIDLNFNWFPQDTLSAVCPIPTWAESGIISNLAVYGAPAMSAPITETTAIKADRGFNTIATILINKSLKSADMTHVPLGYAYGTSIISDT